MIEAGTILRSTDPRDKGRRVHVLYRVVGRGDGELWRVANCETGRRTYVTLRTIRMTYAVDGFRPLDNSQERQS